MDVVKESEGKVIFVVTLGRSYVVPRSSSSVHFLGGVGLEAGGGGGGGVKPSFPGTIVGLGCSSWGLLFFSDITVAPCICF